MGRVKQRGVAILVVVLALLVLGGLMFALGTVRVTAVTVERERSSNHVLAQAKGALIDAAVSDNVRPGQLPCPDVNDDGEATSGIDFIAGTGQCMNLIGRLPWKTLGVADLRDDSGERLWYAVSNDFRASNTAVPLNSDTAFRLGNQSLTLNGFTPGSNLAAIVIAPGAVLKRSDGHSQVRGCGALCNANDFLDIAAAEDNADGNLIFASAQRSDTFNDRLMPVYSDDIMRLVERRAARELAQHLRAHYNAWQTSPVVAGVNNGFYPYAVPWSDPSNTPAQFGTDGTMSGLLPLTTAAPVWSNVTPLICSGNGTPTMQCNTLVICILGICVPDTVSGRIENIATRFVDPPTAANFTLLGLNLGGGPSWTLNKAQRRLEFSYSGIVAAGVLNIQVTAPPISSWVGGWLGANNWHQDAWYAFSPAFQIDGGKVCGGVGPACYTVTNTGTPNNDNHAVIVVSGRALPAAAQPARPAPLPVDFNEFFEGVNSGVGTVFETNARTATFNDTPVAVKP